jgi:hypothetical protein
VSGSYALGPTSTAARQRFEGATYRCGPVVVAGAGPRFLTRARLHRMVAE